MRSPRDLLHDPTTKGVALVAVMWIVAALSVIIGSLSTAVRDSTRVVSAARSSVVGQAAAQAAFNLALQQMTAAPNRPARLSYYDATHRGQSIEVTIEPTTGLIDLNNAPEPLLSALFSVAGGLDEGAATSLAQATIALRAEKDRAGRPSGFEVPEDLLRVPAVPYRLYANISGLITVSARSSGKVNALAAPEPVLRVLAGGNASVAARIAALRRGSETGIDTSALRAEFLDGSVSRTYRLTADVPQPDGGLLRFFQTIEFTTAPTSELPWRILHSGRLYPAAPLAGT